MAEGSDAELRMPHPEEHYVVFDGIVYETQPDPFPEGWKTVAFVPRNGPFKANMTVPEYLLPYYTMSTDGGGWRATWNAAAPGAAKGGGQCFATAELCDSWTRLFYKSGYSLVHSISGEGLESKY